MQWHYSGKCELCIKILGEVRLVRRLLDQMKVGFTAVELPTENLAGLVPKGRLLPIRRKAADWFPTLELGCWPTIRSKTPAGACGRSKQERLPWPGTPCWRSHNPMKRTRGVASVTDGMRVDGSVDAPPSSSRPGVGQDLVCRCVLVSSGAEHKVLQPLAALSSAFRIPRGLHQSLLRANM